MPTGFGAHAQGKSYITTAASASATIIAAPATNSEARLHIKNGVIVVADLEATSSVGVNVMYSTAEGSQAATIFSVSTSITGVYHFDFGEKGYACSASAPRLIFQNTGDAKVYAMFTGYHLGAGTT